MTDYSILRDQWGRPFVSQDGGPLIFEGKKKTPTNAVGYMRVSTLAGVLDDKQNLAPWKAALAMAGMVRERAIYAQVASLVAKHRDPWNQAKTQMKQLVERAQLASSSDDGSGQGTAFHEFTEVEDAGGSLDFMPVEYVPWMDCYRGVMQDFEVIAAEKFVVVDELQAAGSFDKLLRHKPTGRVYIGDLKSGKSDPDYPLKAKIQFASYSRGQYYDQETGERTPIHPDLDQSTAIMIHVPIRSGKPSAEVYAVDIESGWEYAKLAVQVDKARKANKKSLNVFGADSRAA